MKRTLFLILAMLAFGSCRTTNKTLKEQIERLERSNDSLSLVSSRTETIVDTVVKTETIVDKIVTEIEVPIDCDSLGNVREYSTATKTGSTELSVLLKNNRLSLRFKQDSIKNVLEKRFRDRFVSDSLKMVERYRTEILDLRERLESTTVKRPNWNAILWLSAIIAVLTVLLFRKKIPWLKWLPF